MPLSAPFNSAYFTYFGQLWKLFHTQILANLGAENPLKSSVLPPNKGRTLKTEGLSTVAQSIIIMTSPSSSPKLDVQDQSKSRFRPKAKKRQNKKEMSDLDKLYFS